MKSVPRCCITFDIYTACWDGYFKLLSKHTQSHTLLFENSFHYSYPKIVKIWNVLTNIHESANY